MGYTLNICSKLISVIIFAGVVLSEDEFKPNFEDCSSYYMCGGGQCYLMHCNVGLKWNNAIRNCDTECNNDSPARSDDDNNGPKPHPNEIGDAAERGICSFYGAEGEIAQGSYTASGEGFDRFAYKTAHKTLPFGTKIRVTNEDNEKTVDVVVNDRGPGGADRILDLTWQAFGDIEERGKGLVKHCSYVII